MATLPDMFASELSRCQLWQYDKAPNLTAIMEDRIDFYDTQIGGFWKRWSSQVFSISTATTVGLNIWGRILGVSRPMVSATNYTFDTQNNLNWYNPTTGGWCKIWLENDDSDIPVFHVEQLSKLLASTNSISDDVYRKLLLGKIFAFNSNGSIKDINQFLSFIVAGKAFSVWNNRDMTIDVRIGFVPTPSEMAVLTSPDFLPTPAGVLVNFYIADPLKTFGFNGSELATWCTNPETPVPDGLGSFFK